MTKPVGTLLCVRTGECPRHSDVLDGGCDLWWERIMTHRESGEERVVKGCGLSQLPFFLTALQKSVDIGTEHASKTANSSRDLTDVFVSMVARKRLESN